MTDKTVVISLYDDVLKVKNNIILSKVHGSDENGISNEEVSVLYEDLTSAEKVKFDDVIAILESKLA